MSCKDKLFENYDTENNTSLALHLGLTTDELEELGVSHDDLQENTGHSGEMLYGYFLEIPPDAPTYLINKLRENGFNPDDLISLPLNIYPDSQEEDREE